MKGFILILVAATGLLSLVSACTQPLDSIFVFSNAFCGTLTFMLSSLVLYDKVTRIPRKFRSYWAKNSDSLIALDNYHVAKKVFYDNAKR